MRIRSRSEAAVISREPSLPMREDGDAAARQTAVFQRERRLDTRLRSDARNALRQRAIGPPARSGSSTPDRAARRSGTSPPRRSRARDRARPRASPRSQTNASMRCATSGRVESSGDQRRAAGIDRGVEHMRTGGDDVGEPRRAAENVGEQFAQLLRSSAGSRTVRPPPACGRAPRRRRRAPRPDRPSREKASSSAGTSSVSTSRARALCTAARRPKCQPRTVSAACSGRRKPSASQRLQRLGIVGDAGEDEAADAASSPGACSNSRA